MTPPDRARLTRYAQLSIAAAVVTMALKGAAYWLTGSIGLLSDAAESLVNLMGAIVASLMLAVAARPPDEDHAYGHSKAEYFSSVFEGMLILAAALGISATAIDRLLHPHVLEQLGIGVLVTGAATLVNLGAAIVILRAGKKNHSITLEANAHHLFTDVWTSAGVILGIGAVAVTGWLWLDAVVALAVAVNIDLTGYRIVTESVSGLMDSAMPEADKRVLQETLAGFADSGAEFHAVRTRQAGPRRFISMHVLVPGHWTVHTGHELLEKIEGEIRRRIQNVTVFTHLESLDDPASWDDESLDRPER
jgi:cation diffusion facilitator family transporter